jgi:hypothetical protein
VTKIARIQDGVVTEFLTPLEGFALEDCFSADLLAECVPAANTVQIGWLFDGNSFSAPPPPPPPGKPDLIGYAAQRRWEIEVGGIVLGGVPIATDDRSKTMILGARVAAAANPDWETVWHGADGETYPLNAAQMIAISNAVEAHVNATFSTFAGLKADVGAGVITTAAEIDAAFAA